MHGSTMGHIWGIWVKCWLCVDHMAQQLVMYGSLMGHIKGIYGSHGSTMGHILVMYVMCESSMIYMGHRSHA